MTGHEHDDVEDLTGLHEVPRSSPPAVWTPVFWTLAVGLVWVTLAAWRPTTTWHLAPALLAGVAPWVVAQDARAGDRRALRRVVAAAVTGLVVSVLVTWVLASAGLLRGPTIPGFADPLIESSVLAGAGVLLAAAFGLRRVMRAPARIDPQGWGGT